MSDYDEDPFAPPAEETTPAPAPKAAPTTTKKKENTVTETTTENGITATIKAGSGFDAPWLVFRAANADALNEQLHDAALRDVVAQTVVVANAFAKEFTGSQPVQAAPQGGNRPGQPPAAAQAELNDKGRAKLRARFGSEEVPAGWTLKSLTNKQDGSRYFGIMPPQGSDEKPVFYS